MSLTSLFKWKLAAVGQESRGCQQDAALTVHLLTAQRLHIFFFFAVEQQLQTRPLELAT